jgi:L-malate glycosyltransferase
MTERRPRLVIFGPDSVHTHRWAEYVRAASWDVTWIAYGPSKRNAVATIDEVTLETGGRFVVARTIFDLIRGAIRLRRKLRALAPDVLQTHWFLGPMWIAALAGRHPIVATAWGSDVLLPFPGRRAADFLTRLLGKRIDAITSSSEALERALIDSGLPPRRMHRVVHGIDSNLFKPLPRSGALLNELGVDALAPVILSPRGVIPVYDPEMVLRAFEQLLMWRPATLLLRVPADQRAEWHELCGALAPQTVEHIVIFEGVARERFPELLASCDVVVSVARSEGSSITVLEALFCERPLIVSDIPPNREWVTDESFGTIVGVGDADDLARGIDRILADPAAASSKARHAAVHARMIGDQTVSLASVVTLYESLLEQS